MLAPFMPEKQRLHKALESLGMKKEAEVETVTVPTNFKIDELAWNFNGQVKFLTDCTTDELLYVIKILCIKYSENSERLMEYMRVAEFLKNKPA